MCKGSGGVVVLTVVTNTRSACQYDPYSSCASPTNKEKTDVGWLRQALGKGLLSYWLPRAAERPLLAGLSAGNEVFQALIGCGRLWEKFFFPIGYRVLQNALGKGLLSYWLPRAAERPLLSGLSAGNEVFQALIGCGRLWEKAFFPIGYRVLQNALGKGLLSYWLPRAAERPLLAGLSAGNEVFQALIGCGRLWEKAIFPIGYRVLQNVLYCLDCQLAMRCSKRWLVDDSPILCRRACVFSPPCQIRRPKQSQGRAHGLKNVVERPALPRLVHAFIVVTVNSTAWIVTYTVKILEVVSHIQT
ncbi:hypothetical protein PR048_033000 [Dryococelus australis]|uniref:Uncharacterized protein n=1 Tax=Dryococelus australis TaxID=614101 RepID=A0ABQ9G7Z0_9NEOP|nr:hypothetical protein PR048_033000 [Dryococelus australis]